MEDIVILGYGGHARSVADSIIRTGLYTIAGYTDPSAGSGPVRYLGTDDVLEDLYRSGVRMAVLGMGFLGASYLRDSLVKRAEEIGYQFPAIIDPSAVIAEDAVISKGSFVGKQAVLNAGSSVGEYCIINTSAVVEHESVVCGYSHVAVGALLCGNVSVGSHTLIGAGTTVLQGTRVGNGCIIGAGSLILRDVPDDQKVIGTYK